MPLILAGLVGGIVTWIVFQRIQDLQSKQRLLAMEWPVPQGFDPFFNRLTPEVLVKIPIATRFDPPVGSEHGALAYNAQGFDVPNERRGGRHAGEDLNGIGGQNSDLGDPIFASADGLVVFAGEVDGGWGGVLILAHRLPMKEGDPPGGRVIQSVYAHLDQIHGVVGRVVQRGEKIGTMGNAKGEYWAHLHWELRENLVVMPGVGYFPDDGGILDRLPAEQWVKEHRGASEDALTRWWNQNREEFEFKVAP